MPIKITVDLKCDNCKRKFQTRSVKVLSRRGGYQSFPDVLFVEYERMTATVDIIKGINECWTGKDKFGVDIACSVRCVMALAQKRVEKLAKSKESSEDY